MDDELSKAIAGLTGLETLELGRLGVTVESLQTLSRLEPVEKLGLAGCKLLGDAAIDVLAGWQSLQRLDLQETSVTATAVAKLRDARPALRVLANPDKPDSIGVPEVAAERAE
jgi:hypothetical protein